MPWGPANWALVAKPLSPLKPWVALPAMVVIGLTIPKITPFETLRMRLAGHKWRELFHKVTVGSDKRHLR